MENNSDKIIMNSLLEEREQLKRILTDPDVQSVANMEDRIITWANDLLMAASDNEPGQVNLIPFPIPVEEMSDNIVQKNKHQSLGSGSRIRKNKHQSLGSGPPKSSTIGSAGYIAHLINKK